jgi:hypothetical protein
LFKIWLGGGGGGSGEVRNEKGAGCGNRGGVRHS